MSAQRTNGDSQVISRPCPRCNGTGQEPLPPHLQETYDLIRYSAKTAGFVADRLGVSDPAANNRLKELVALGLLQRKRAVMRGGGNLYLYRRPRGISPDYRVVWENESEAVTECFGMVFASSYRAFEDVRLMELGDRAGAAAYGSDDLDAITMRVDHAVIMAGLR